MYVFTSVCVCKYTHLCICTHTHTQLYLNIPANSWVHTGTSNSNPTQDSFWSSLSSYLYLPVGQWETWISSFLIYWDIRWMPHKRPAFCFSVLHVDFLLTLFGSGTQIQSSRNPKAGLQETFFSLWSKSCPVYLWEFVIWENSKCRLWFSQEDVLWSIIYNKGNWEQSNVYLVNKVIKW